MKFNRRLKRHINEENSEKENPKILDLEDIIPDYIPETGYLDDVYCLNLCLARLRESHRPLWEDIELFIEKNQR